MNITEKTSDGIPVTPSKWIFTSLAIMFKTFVILKVFKRYQRNLDLIHLLQLNVLVDLTLLFQFVIQFLKHMVLKES